MTGYLNSLRAKTLMLIGVFSMLSLPAAAQVPTGTIAGRVVDSGGAVVRHAIVTVESPNLLGVRTTSTSDEGYYIVTLLPPGRYTVTVEAGQFAPAKTGHV